jgi:hypothetical protein
MGRRIQSKRVSEFRMGGGRQIPDRQGVCVNGGLLPIPIGIVGIRGFWGENGGGVEGKMAKVEGGQEDGHRARGVGHLLVRR